MPKISKGYRKFIRSQKANIRKVVVNPDEKNKQIENLYVDIKDAETSKK